jgi:hypothetical protein
MRLKLIVRLHRLHHVIKHRERWKDFFGAVAGR